MIVGSLEVCSTAWEHWLRTLDHQWFSVAYGVLLGDFVLKTSEFYMEHKDATCPLYRMDLDRESICKLVTKSCILSCTALGASVNATDGV
jgi:hypothetical protein